MAGAVFAIIITITAKAARIALTLLMDITPSSHWRSLVDRFDVINYYWLYRCLLQKEDIRRPKV
jgi:hypothetical protein